MNKLKLFIGAILLLSATTFAWTQLASAHSFRSGSNVAVGQGEKVDHTLFVAGQTVDISSEVFGDVFCAGQTVTVSGTVHGDVICAGQTVTITGKVDGDVRLVGQTVTLGAEVAGNATIGGQTFNLESRGKIAGDATIGSEKAVFNGPVGRDLAVGGSNATISSTVGRDIKGSLENLSLASGARVQGNIDFTSSNDISKAEGSVIGGKVTRTDAPKEDQSKRGAVFGFSLGWFIYCFLALLITAMALALLFPRMLHTVSGKAMPRPWKALLTGFLASISVPVILIILAITVVGLPLAFIVGLSWLIILMLSGPLFGYYLGRQILRDSRQPLLIMLVGASLLIVSYFIPVIGFLAVLAAIWIGAGMALLAIFDKTPRPAYNLAKTSPKRKS